MSGQILSEDKATPASAVNSFVPYSSVLSFMTSPLEIAKDDDEEKSNNYEKKKKKTTKFPKNGKLLNPLNARVAKSKSVARLEIQVKKQKAILSRKKAQSKVVTTIELQDSDESDCIPVELPPPPLITLDSSDEETIKKKRALSPSISSIMSDDFIAAGDKRLLANPFKQDEVHLRKLQDIAKQKETFKKVKAVTKNSSSTSSSPSGSARSSCERNVSREAKVTVTTEQKKSAGAGEARSKRKIANINSDEDSIYGSKGKLAQQSKKADSSGSSDEEPLCVNAKNVAPSRRKSTGSRNKSAEEDSDPILGPIALKNKRSRFITPSYDDEDFATMISSIVRSKDSVENESNDDEEKSEEVKEATKAVKSTETAPSSSVIMLEADGDIEVTITEINDTISTEEDCELIEEPQVVIDVPDDDDKGCSDSDDSMRGFKKPIECDLSLNVTQVPYEPHEYIRDYGESSQATAVPSNECSVNPEIGWNDEMKFFYDGSWGDENFCIARILTELPRDQKFWRVNNADRNRTSDSGKRIRCMKCNEVGHFARQCTRPKKRIVCFMCGEEGHRETRCPHAICLRV